MILFIMHSILPILVTAFGPLGSPERPWSKEGDPVLLENPKLKQIGEKYGKSPAQICIRWQLQRGISVIPKSSTPSRLKENCDVSFSFISSKKIIFVFKSP